MIHTFGPNNDKVMTIATYKRKINIQFHFKQHDVSHCVTQKLHKYYTIKQIKSIRKNIIGMNSNQIINALKELNITPPSKLLILLKCIEKPDRVFVDIDYLSGLTYITSYEVIELPIDPDKPNKKFKRGEIKRFGDKLSIPGIAECGAGDTFDAKTGRIYAFADWVLKNAAFFI